MSITPPYVFSDGNVARASQVNANFATVYNQVNTNTLDIGLLKTYVTPEMFNAIGDGIADDTAALQQTFNASANVVLNGTYKVSSQITLSGMSGKDIFGTGTIKAESGVSIASLILIVGVSNIRWDGPSIDQNQTSGTGSGDSKCTNGFYIKDSQYIRISNTKISNVKYGYPIYIDGTSSVSPISGNGSKWIFIDSVTCQAYSTGVVDTGAGVYIRSDFYIGSFDSNGFVPSTADGATVFYASNGVKTSDYTVDVTKAYQRTTQNIYFSNCYFENMDRVGLFNVKNVHFTDCRLVSFTTRGYALSPTCENVTVSGGSISGNAAQIVANFACKNVIFNNLIADGETVSIGQRHALRCGFGTEGVRFSNIIGIGSDYAHAYVEGAKDVVFDNVSLKPGSWSGGTTVHGIVVVGGGPSNTSSFIVSGIRFIGCNFSANYAMSITDTSGTATISSGGIIADDCVFTASSSFFNGSSPTTQLIYTDSNISSVTGPTVYHSSYVAKELTQNSATPSVANYPNWVCNQTSPTSITAFTGGIIGQLITVRLDTYTTIVSSTNLHLLNGVNKVATGSITTGSSGYDILTFQCVSTDTWYEVGESRAVSGDGLNGTSAPSSTPKYIGQNYVDTSAKKVYVATGVSSSADWTAVN